MVRVLHIVTALDGGGIENMILNYYSHMDRENIKFDFITHGKNGNLEPYFEQLGSEIYFVPPLRNSIRENLRLTRKIIANGNYDVVHSHIGISSVFSMYFSKRFSIQTRITHSHLAFRKESFLRRIIIRILRFFNNNYSTQLLACSKDAGKYLWGEKAVSNGSVKVINNAIDIEKFRFNKLSRNNIRHELNIEDKFVIGNVARFDYQKNHEFLIKIFSEIYKVNKESILLLVGNGELEDEVKKQVDKLGLKEAVKFLGVRNDVHKLMHAMDVFLLPSRYEGLGMVFIEAQANSLISFGSDIIVPKEAKATDLMNFISLDKSPDYWANEVLNYKDGYIRESTTEQIKKAGFDIRNECGKLVDIYAESNN
ncbi:glycosyltransferase family 1 protein [Sporosarcina psychrophila]|uniref:Glycosyltransferase involved in cell wall biosynthesis n=1 Tax=Sporosarcina psychrophila TaxID=1476 RepID=A0ABV2K636_SPOPS